MATEASNPFDNLPIETNQNIATFLESDIDLCHYRQVCCSTRDAVNGDGNSFWRRRFTSVFETPSWSSSGKRLEINERFRLEYSKRKGHLKNGAIFQRGTSKVEKACLEMLRDMIIDCFSDKNEDDEHMTYKSKNMAHILRFIDANNLLNIIFLPQHAGRRTSDRRPSPTPLLHTIQCLLAPALFSFNEHMMNDHYSFPDSQRVVYSTATEQPAFVGCNGLDVNMEWVLHHINFWKYHMLRREELTLYEAFKELDESERPRWWSQQLGQETKKLGKHWKGSYAYVEHDDIDLIRAGKGEEQQICDTLNGEGQPEAFQDLRLEFTNPDEMPWSAAFENILHSLARPVNRAKTRAQHRSATPDPLLDYTPKAFRFDGDGYDAYEEFCASGWLNPLPPQHGVPGWQRMTMMKYYEDEHGEKDLDALWAYEGVVLPGGQIMLGRWWSPKDDEVMYSGPFILWCVDGPKYDAAEDEEMTAS